MKHFTRSSFRLFSLVAALIIISASCNLKNKSRSNAGKTDSAGTQMKAVDSTKISVITQKYSTGVTKSEIAVKGNKREGITRNYHEDGSLMSEITYVNNEKNGISRDFYPNGKARMEITYKRGIMQGDAKWYYQSGEVYRVTPYINGQAEGIQKLYYKDGKVKAEVPYKSGVIAPGLKEYTETGVLLPTPSIVIEEIDKIAMEGKFILKMHLSNHAGNAKWYEGDLKDWSAFPKALSPVNNDQNGNGILSYSASHGAVVMRTIYIYAVLNTEMGNQCILKKKYDLAYK